MTPILAKSLIRASDESILDSIENSAVNTFVDCHVHFFKANRAIEGARYKPNYTALLEHWQAQSEPLNIKRAVVIQTSFMGHENQTILELLGANPALLRAVIAIAPTTPLAQMQQWDQLGVRGIRLNLAGGCHDLSAWIAHTPFIENVIKLGWHCEIHHDQDRLADVLNQLPIELPVVIDHMGKLGAIGTNDPGIQAVRKRGDHSPVYVKLSGSYRLNGLDPKTLAQLWLNTLGPNQLLWGSDWPCTNFEMHNNIEQLLEQLKLWLNGDQKVIHTTLVENPNRLFWRAQSVQN